MAKFRKKPVVIEAVQWVGENSEEMDKFFENSDREWGRHGDIWSITTLEGVMDANLNDWVIKGVKGEYYPCKPDIFEATYEPV